MNVRFWKCANGTLIATFILAAILGCLAGNLRTGYLNAYGSSAVPFQMQESPQNESIQVFIEYNGNTTISELTSAISTQKGKIIFQYPSLYLIFAAIPCTLLSYFQSRGMKYYIDRCFSACLDQSVPLIKPPTTWAALETYFGNSINGSGVTVAVLDTGIEAFHPDLDDLDDNATTADPKILNQASFVLGNPNPDDDNGHGTHCAGIIGGTGADSGGLRKGVAPSCYLLNAKVLDKNGVGLESWILQGIEWALQNGANVISLSLATNESGDGTDPLSRMIEYAVQQGVTVVLAAGNKGPAPYTIGRPGVCASAITVGASDGNTLVATSSWGPTQSFLMKPDILAPSTNIKSCSSSGTGYTTMSGTSQAAAFVAGAVALLRQARPAWTPLQIKNALLSNAINLGLDPYKQGAGRLYVPSALNTSILIGPPADFTLFHTGTNSRDCIITNLRPYPVTVTYTADKYQLNVSSPFTLPVSGSRVITLSIQPNTSAATRLWEYLNFTVEQKSLHLIACGIKPTLESLVPAGFLYNTTCHLNVTLRLDLYPTPFLKNSTISVRINTSLMCIVPISSNGSFPLAFSAGSLSRGSYLLTTQAHINNSLICELQRPIQIYGYPSYIAMQNLTEKQGEVSFRIDSLINVTGDLRLYILLKDQWTLIYTCPSSNPYCLLSANYAAGNYLLKINYTGSAL